MAATPAASPDDIEMSSIIQALKARAPKLLLTSAVLAALTFAVLALMAPRYQSQSELAIAARGSSNQFANPNAAAPGNESIATKMDKEAINTHVRALQSNDLISIIADELRLAEKPEFNSAVGPVDTIDAAFRLVGLGGPRPGETVHDRVLKNFRERLEVYSAKESRFIGIRFSSIDPQLAATIANRLAESYRASLATQGVSEIDDQQKVLTSKIERLQPEVAAAETEVERYRGEINVFKGGAQNTGLNEQQMSELTGELTRAKASRGEADARSTSAREMMKLGSADALPDVQKSPLIQNLVQQRVRIERQLSELSATLLPGHPRMQQMNADLSGLKRQIQGEVSKIVDSLDKEAKVAQGREDSIKRSLDDLKTRVVSNAPEEAKLRQLEGNVKAKRTELDNLQAQLESNRKKLDTRAQPVEAQLISKAQPASVPIFPKKLPLSALVAVAWLLFGAAWTVTRALFYAARSGPAKPAQPVVRGLEAMRTEPALTAQSRVSPAASPSVAALPPLVHDAEMTETSIAGLVRRLKSQGSSQSGHRTLMTGEIKAVDATADVIDVAKALAETGVQVILVDWSPSGRGMSDRLDIAHGAGVSELLLGEESFEAVVKRVPGSTVHFIPCGAAFDAAFDLDADQVNLVLDALDEAYDHILVAGAHDEARQLFETIQGRFDSCIVVADSKKRMAVIEDPPGSFLGFEVADIDVIRFERPLAQPSISQQRILRAAQRGGAEQRPV